MHVKKVTVEVKPSADGVPRIVATLWSGEGSTPVPYPFEIDPATALVLAGKLEDAVHKVNPPTPIYCRVIEGDSDNPQSAIRNPQSHA